MSSRIKDLLSDNPVISSVKNPEGVKEALKSDCNVVFILYGNICEIKEVISSLKNAGKTVFVHVDLIDGLSSREIAIEFLHKNASPDGIITTKGPLIKAAKALGLMTVHRFFMLDSLSLQNIPKQIAVSTPDCIEVLPGCMPKVISKLTESIDLPIIAGGLIQDKSDVMAALSAGADAISTTKSTLWEI